MTSTSVQRCFPSGVYPILDLDSCSSFAKDPRSLLDLWQRKGLSCFQFRAKRIPDREYLEFTEKWKEHWPEGVILANDRLELALKFPELYSGIHLGQSDLTLMAGEWIEELIIRLERDIDFVAGVSTHNIKELARVSQYFSETDRGDMEIPVAPIPWSYIAMGPFFPTASSKQDTSPVLTVEGSRHLYRSILGMGKGGRMPDARRMVASASRPAVVLIGGIDSGNLAAILDRLEAVREAPGLLCAIITAAMDEAELDRLSDLMSYYNA